ASGSRRRTSAMPIRSDVTSTSAAVSGSARPRASSRSSASRPTADTAGATAGEDGGGVRGAPPPVVYVSYAQVPAPQMAQVTYALRTDGDPLRYASAVRQIVHGADARGSVTNLKTQAADIDQTISQEIVFARLCSAFAFLALTIACVGLYATMAY